MRRALLAGLAGLALVLPAVPAHAEGAIVLTCNVTYSSTGTGIGTGTGTGSCNVTGVIQLGPRVLTPAYMTFDYFDGTTCGMRTVYGYIEGASYPPIQFAWTKIGPIGAMYVSGPLQGGGYTESVTISGSPCWPLSETMTSLPMIVGT